MIQGYMTTDALILFFLFFSLTIAIVIKSLQKKWSFLPFAPSLFVLSIIMGKFSDSLGLVGDSIKATSGIDPRGILLIFLPPLIFQSSFSSDWYVFRKQASQIFILAFPCVLVGALLIMASIKLVIGYDDSYYTYLQAFMFGSILSCTDTVAVLALLKQAGAPKKFRSLIQGQSLINDGSCMILFTISIELCKGGSMGVVDITTLFVELTGGAVVLGVIFGMIATELIKLFKNDPLLCYNTTLVGCYLVYFVAQYVHLGIHVSGIMALVSMGLYMAAFCRTKFTTEARERVHHIWKVYVFVAQTVIFILGGVIVGQKSLNNPKLIDLIGVNQILCLFGLYICMTCARFLAIALFMPKLRNLGYGLTWNEVGALTYGGLRGAIGIAFTLILCSNEFLPQKFRSISIFNMAGCAFLTLMINAPTCRPVIQKLGLCSKSETKVKLFNKFMKICKKELQEKIDYIHKNDKYLTNSNWEKVVHLSGIEELQSHIDREAKSQRNISNLQRMDSVGQPMLEEVEIDQNSMVQIRSRFGIALKGIFWHKFQNKECTDQTVKKLTECVDLDLDSAEEPLNSWDYLISEEQNNFFFAIIYWLRQFPIINHYAFTQIYHKVRSIYDLVSTYIEAMDQCDQVSEKFPFDKYVLSALKQEVSHNKKLAQAYLDSQIKNSYPQIMKKVQTSKVSVALLNYQLQMLEKNHKQGRVDELFYFQLRLQIENNLTKIENDISVNEQMPTAQAFRALPVFQLLQTNQFDELMIQRVQKLIQKDQLILRSYEKVRYIYYVVKGQINEEWKLPDNTFKKRTIKRGDFLGLSQMCIPHSQDIQYTAVANSVTCLYGFPIQKIRETMTKNTKFQAELNKQMLPIIVLLSKNMGFSQIPPIVWSRIRNEVEYNRVPKSNHHTVQNIYVILIQGTISIDSQTFSQGYYKLLGQKGIITGPAKYVISPHPFEDFNDHEKRLSEAINKGIKNEGPSAFDKALLQYD